MFDSCWDPDSRFENFDIWNDTWSICVTHKRRWGLAVGHIGDPPQWSGGTMQQWHIVSAAVNSYYPPPLSCNRYTTRCMTIQISYGKVGVCLSYCEEEMEAQCDPGLLPNCLFIIIGSSMRARAEHAEQDQLVILSQYLRLLYFFQGNSRQFSQCMQVKRRQQSSRQCKKWPLICSEIKFCNLFRCDSIS